MKKLTLIFSILIGSLTIANAQVVTTLAGNTSGGGSNNGTGTVAQFNQPYGVVTDGTNLYVVDQGNNIIRKVVIATGVVTRLAGGGGVNSTFQGHANGTGTAATFVQPAGAASDGTNLYIADYNNNLIRQIVISTGVVTTIAGGGSAGGIVSGHADGTGTAATFSHPNGLFVYGDTLFIADAGNNEIRSLVLSTGVVTTFAGSTTSGHADGTGTAATFSNPYSVVADKKHNLYVVDNGNNEIRQIVIPTGVVTTFAGSTASGHANGTGTTASFNNPNGITTDGNGNLYLADVGNQEIRKIVISSAAVTTYAGSTTGGSADGIGTAATFSFPIGIVADASGNLYVTDLGNNEIRALSPAAPVAAFNANNTTVCSGGTVQFTDISSNTPTSWSWTFQNGSPRTSTAQNPLITFYTAGADTVKLVVTNASGSDSIIDVAYITVNALPAITIATDVIGGGLACGHYDTLTANATGNGSFSYSWNTTGTRDTIMVTGGVPDNGGIVTTFAGSTSGGSANGIGTAAKFNAPNSITSDGLGNLYITDLQNDDVRKVVISTGVVTTLAGGSYGSSDGVGTNAQFITPAGIAYDGNGNLFVTDNQAIRKIVIATGEVTTFAGSATNGSMDGIGTAAEFTNPRGLAYDGNGNLYVADSYNQEIRVISTSTGSVTTYAGSTSSGNVDGIGTASQFRYPSGLAYDGNGNLYVADQGNAEVRKIVLSSAAVTTIAGDGYAGSANGVGTAATFSGPNGLVYDGYGNLYIVDLYNNNIRKMVLSSGNVTTYCGTANVSGSANGTGSSAQFNGLTSITMDESGNFYVADEYNNEIRKIAIPNTYVVKVTDANGCSSTAFTNAASFALPAVSISADVIGGTVFCKGAIDTLIAKATGVGALMYNWSNGAITDTILTYSANTFSVTVTDATGCSNTASKNITANPLPVLSITNDIVGGSVACAHFDTLTANATGTGILKYAWNTTGTNDTIMVGSASPPGGIVTTLAGSNYGFVNGTGTAAEFNYIGGVVSDGNGNLYVTDGNNRAIRKIVVATGAVSTLAGGPYGSADGIGTAAQFEEPYGIAYDGSGNLFVTDPSTYTIRQINLSSLQVTTIAGNGSYGSIDGTGTAAGFGPIQGIACDGSGNLFVTDEGNQSIRQVVISTGIVTTLAGGGYGSSDGVGTSAQFGTPYGIAYDGNGNLYVVDEGNDEIRKVVISSATVTTLVGSPGASGSKDDTGSAASFNAPMGIGYDGNGYLYVADGNNNEIRQITISSRKVTTLCGNTTAGYTDATGSAAQFQGPNSVTVDGKGNLYVGDEGNSRIREIAVPNTFAVTVTDANGCSSMAHSFGSSYSLPVVNINENVISGNTFCAGTYDTLSTNITGNGPFTYLWNTKQTTDSILADSAIKYSVAVTDVNGCVGKQTTLAALQMFPSPTLTITSDVIGGGLACGHYDTLTANAVGTGLLAYSWNTSGTNDTIMVGFHTTSGAGIVTTFAGNGAYGSTNGIGTAAQFGYTKGVAADGNGNLFVADEYWNNIREINISTGLVSTLAGSSNGVGGFADGIGSAARFNNPNGITADGNGNLYVTETGNNAIRKVVVATGAVTTIAGNGSTGSMDGVGTAAQFNQPGGLTYDGAGNLYVADLYNEEIRKVIVATGVVTTFAGSSSAGEQDGTGTAAQFYGPSGVTFDGSGNLFVTDEWGSVIRKINIASVAVTTLAGKYNSNASVDGIGSAANFYYPMALIYDGNGDLYVADQNNSEIRKVVISTAAVTTLAGTTTSGNSDGTGTAAAFHSPDGIAMDASGNLYVSDEYNYDIRKIAIPNNYAVTVTDANGCSSTAHANAYSFPNVTGSITVKNSNGGGVVCNGAIDTLIASASGNSVALTYSWSNVASRDTDIVVSGGTYSVTVTDSVGCTAVISKTVIADPSPTLTIKGNVLTSGYVCNGSFDTLTAVATGAGSLGYSWSNTGTNDTAMVTPSLTNIAMVSTLAGSSVSGAVNGIGTSATFNYNNYLTSDGNGNLYVADNSNSVIRKINIASGLVTTLAGTPGVTGNTNGIGAAARFSYPNGIVYDGSGNLYVADGSYQIRKIVIATGVVSTLAGSATYGSSDGIGTAASFGDPSGITIDGSGNLYVADLSNNEIRQIVISTAAVTTLAGSTSSGSSNGIGTAARFYQPADLTYDGNGNLYVADKYNYEIRKIVIATGMVSTFAGSTSAGNANGTGAAAKFRVPQGITYDGNGDLYVGDAGNNIVRKIVISTAAVTTLAGSASGNVNGTATVAEFSSPVGLNYDGKGNLYVADAGNNEIRKIILPNTYSVIVKDGNGCTNTTSITVNVNTIPAVSIAGNKISGATICGGLQDTLTATATGNGSFKYSWNTTGTNDSVIVANAGVYTVTATDVNGCKDTASKRVIATPLPVVVINTDIIGGAAFCTGMGDTLTAVATGNAGFTYKWSNGVNASSNMVTSPGTYSVSVTDKNGCVNTASESITVNPSPTVNVTGNIIANGKAICVGLLDSLKATASGNGTLSYLWNNTGTNDTALVTPSLSGVTMVSTLAGSGSSGSTDGFGASARFSRPYAAVPDGNGNVYVADYNNSRIRKVFIATGLVTTIAGSSNGYIDGVGTAAKFSRPTDLAYDGLGNLYVADAGNTRIRKIVIATGVVTTLAGSSSGSADGIGTAAGFSYPSNLVYDGAGNLYVSDQGNSEIRQVVVSTGAVTTLAGNTGGGSADGIGAAASFDLPAGITYDGIGKLFIADVGNNNIRQVVVSSATVSTLAGTTTSGSANGTGTAASFYQPMGITYDGNGNLYVAEYRNNDIRKVAIATAAVTTLAGSTTSGNINGTATSARFNRPTDVRYDGNGNLYISEYNNNDVRKITLPNTYSVVVTDGNGCKNIASFGSVAVNTTPTVTVSANIIGGTTICAGINDTLMASATGNGSFTYKWNTASTNDTAIIREGGNYTVTVTDVNKCSTVATESVTANPTPTVIVTGRNTVNLGGGDTLTAGGAITYAWTSGSISDTTIIKPLTTTTYTVTGTDGNGCKGTSTFTVTVGPTSMSNVVASNKTTLYPNPTISSINLSFEMQGVGVPAVVKIIDGIGREVMSENTSISNGKVLTLDVSMLAQGMYYVKVITNDNTQVEKFIKQ